jgi:molecular chaperone DnaK
VAGGYNETIVEKNTPVPVERTRRFTTSKDFQTEVHIQVSQGEERVFADNERLGVLILHGLQPRPRGEAVIEVTFVIDGDGILNVRARDNVSDQETRATMQVVGAPTRDEATQGGVPGEVLPSAL